MMCVCMHVCVCGCGCIFRSVDCIQFVYCAFCYFQLMTVIGNENANKFWEWSLPPEDRIHSDADESVLIILLFIHVLPSVL